MRATKSDWQKRVATWQASGLSAQEFAGNQGLNASTLAWWVSKLRVEARRRKSAFIEVSVPMVRSTGRIDVVVRGGVRIEVSGAFDAEVLRRVVAALEER